MILPPCDCRACIGVLQQMQHMVVCPKCGNKRCPKADWHLYKCSGSNALDQKPELEGS